MRLSISAVGFLYRGVEPFLFVPRAYKGKCRSPRTSKREEAKQKLALSRMAERSVSHEVFAMIGPAQEVESVGRTGSLAGQSYKGDAVRDVGPLPKSACPEDEMRGRRGLAVGEKHVSRREYCFHAGQSVMFDLSMTVS